MREPLCITGAGVVCPLALSPERLLAALLADEHVERAAPPKSALPHVYAEHWPATAPGDAPDPAGPLGGARVGEFGAAAFIDATRRRRVPRLAQMAIVAAQQALGRTAPLSGPQTVSAVEHYGGDRLGVVLGTGLGMLDLTLEFLAQMVQEGPSAASPASFPYTVMNAGAALVAMELGLRGPNVTVNHRDLSAHEALAHGCDLLHLGRADALLVGGCDELGAGLLHTYARLGLLAESPRPYGQKAHGLLPAEGAVMFLIERTAAAKKRGQPILGHILGIGRAGDDRPRLGGTPAGRTATWTGAAASVERALCDAGLAGDKLSAVLGGGRGLAEDGQEAVALQAALGAVAREIPLTSIHGQVGDWPTASAARLLAALLCLGKQVLPKTHGAELGGHSAVPGLCHENRWLPLETILVPAFAQGGGNVSVIIGREG